MKARFTVCVVALILAGCSSESDVEKILEVLETTPWHQSAAVADMTGDGLPDIVTVSQTFEDDRAIVNVFVQQPGGSFASREEVALGSGPAYRVGDVKVSDLNLDGQPDVVVAHLGMTAAGSTPGNRISVLLKTGLGATDFGPVDSYIVGANPSRSSVGDLDQDGLADIAVATESGLDLLIQDGGNPGQFLSAVRVDDVRTRDVAIGDIDNDGVSDLMSAGEFGVRLFVNDLNKPGNFFLAGSWTTNTWPSALTLNDFDGDSRLDFAVTFSTSDAFDRAGVSSRLQDPVNDAVFGVDRDVTFSGVRTLFSIDSADLNGDGRADVVAGVTSGPERVSIAVQLATTDGQLTEPTYFSHPEVSGPWMAVIGQLGPDNLQDVVLAHSLNGVYVHYGSGAGAFRQGVKIGD